MESKHRLQGSMETTNTTRRQTKTTVTARKRIGFRVAAIGIGLSVVLLAELLLRAFNVGSPQRIQDPLVGFSQVHSLFERDGDRYRTARSRQLYFGEQDFAAVKPQNGFRVFCLGGSTVRGRPYHTDTAFAQWLKLELAACDSRRQYEVVNCGALSYASYRLCLILDEVLTYEPDLIVIATGHNEYLEDRTYTSIKERSSVRAWIEDRLLSLRLVTTARGLLPSADAPDVDDGRTVLGDDVEARLDQAGGYASYHRDEQWRADVIHHFDVSVRRMVRMCRDTGVPVILVSLGANLRDTAPFKSEHRTDLTSDDERRWQHAIDIASAEQAEAPRAALDAYRNAEQIDPDYALLSYRIARCLEQLGRHEESAAYYQRARNDDICPLRALDEMSVLLNQIAGETRTPLVDARGLLQQDSPQQIAGHDRYVDHVHPNIASHQRIAQSIAQTIRDQSLAPDVGEWTNQDRRHAYRQHLVSLGEDYLGDGRIRLQWLEHWAHRNRLLEETLPIDGRGYLHRGFRRFGFDEVDAAWEDFRTALQDDPSNIDALMDYALELFEEGRAGAASRLLTQLERETDNEMARQKIAIAQFAIAADTGDRTTMLTISQEHSGALSQAAADPWMQTVPSAVSPDTAAATDK